MIPFSLATRAVRGGCWRLSLALFVASCVHVNEVWGVPDYAAKPRPTREESIKATACDADFVRAQAVRSVPDYEVDAVRIDHGIITLLFIDRNGAGTFAMALRASGTHIFTSVMGIGIGRAEMDRASEPIAMWWEIPHIQSALTICSEAVPDAAFEDLDAALHVSAESALAEHARGLKRVPRQAALLLGAAWIALAALLFSGDLSPLGKGRPKRSLFALFTFSLILHWLLSSGGPGELRLNLTPIWWPAELELRWGPAPIALFRLLALVLGHVQDTHIIWCNLILSSLVPVLTYGILAELGLTSSAALLAAFVVSAHPLLIAFSGVLERQPTYLFAALGSTLAVIVFLKRGGVRSFIAFVLGTALAVLSRPEGAHVLVVHAAILLFAPVNLRRRAAFALTLGLLAALAYAYIRFGLTADVALKRPTTMIFTDLTPMLWTVLMTRHYTPLAWIFAWTAGLVLGIRRRAAWLALAILAGLHLIWTFTGLYESFVGYELWVSSARYQSILLLPFAIGTALFIDACLATGTRIRVMLAVAFVALSAVTFRDPYYTLLRPFTVDYEYRFLRERTLALSPDSRVYIFPSADDVGLVDARYVGHFIGSSVRFDVWSPHACDNLARDVGENYLYLGTSCAAVLNIPPDLEADYNSRMRDCTVIRNRLAADVVQEVDVPARKVATRDFKESTVRLGLYRLKPSSICPPPRENAR